MRGLALVLGMLAGGSACPTFAATTISQTRIAAGDGKHLATGTITITATAAFTAADGVRVETTPLVVSVVNGAFSVALEPNDTGVPSGTQYSAVWQLTGARLRRDLWQVPTSSLGLAVGSVVVSTVTLPATIIQWQQLGQNGATTGMAPVWNGSSWQPGYVTGSGAAWGAIVGTLANQADLAAALAGKASAASLAAVATSGSYGDLSNQPVYAYTATFTGQTAVTVLGTTHGLGTANLTVQCWDAGTPANEVEADTITVDPGSYDVTVNFVAAQSGKCVVRR